MKVIPLIKSIWQKSFGSKMNLSRAGRVASQRRKGREDGEGWAGQSFLAGAK